MSSTLTLSTGANQKEDVHGTLADAKDYVAAMFGPTYQAWLDLVGQGGAVDDPKKQTLIAAVRLLNALAYNVDAATFAQRDAITDLDGRLVFTFAEYELAVAINAKPKILQLFDTGSNIRMVGGGGVPSVEYFNPTSARAGTASRLPEQVQRWIGKYLTSSVPTGSVQGGSGLPPPCGPGWGRSGPF